MVSMNAALGKKGYWGYCRLEQFTLLYLCELCMLVLDTASRNRQFISLRVCEWWHPLVFPPIVFLKVASFL